MLTLCIDRGVATGWATQETVWGPERRKGSQRRADHVSPQKYFVRIQHKLCYRLRKEDWTTPRSETTTRTEKKIQIFTRWTVVMSISNWKWEPGWARCLRSHVNFSHFIHFWNRVVISWRLIDRSSKSFCSHLVLQTPQSRWRGNTTIWRQRDVGPGSDIAFTPGIFHYCSHHPPTPTITTHHPQIRRYDAHILSPSSHPSRHPSPARLPHSLPSAAGGPGCDHAWGTPD